MDMKANLNEIYQRIAAAQSRSLYASEQVQLIAVSKTKPVELIQSAVDAGVTDLGENRAEEMHAKKETLDAQGLTPNWHLIGTLQSRKVRTIVGDPYLIHSVDTLSLAQEISKRYTAKELTARILLEVNVSGEESKHGFSSEEVKQQFESILSLPSLEVCGLMTMAPIQQKEGQAREVFEKTRVLFEQLKDLGADQENWKYLSMGMSQDYRDAIICGATHVRIGTAIFGKRDYPDPV